MEEFEIPVTYNSREYRFKTTLQVRGYTHCFVVNVNGQNINFEPDEEKNYRAVLNYEEVNDGKLIDRELMKAISHAIQDILK